MGTARATILPSSSLILSGYAPASPSRSSSVRFSGEFKNFFIFIMSGNVKVLPINGMPALECKTLFLRSGGLSIFFIKILLFYISNKSLFFKNFFVCIAPARMGRTWRNNNAPAGHKNAGKRFGGGRRRTKIARRDKKFRTSKAAPAASRPCRMITRVYLEPASPLMRPRARSAQEYPSRYKASKRSAERSRRFTFRGDSGRMTTALPALSSSSI